MKAFNKDDLKSGYVVQLKSGGLRMVMRAGKFTHILVAPNGSWTYLSRWNDDLSRVNGCRDYTISDSYGEERPAFGDDIVRVYGLVQSPRNYQGVLSISTESRPILWEKDPPREMTLQDIERELGYRVKLVSIDEY